MLYVVRTFDGVGETLFGPFCTREAAEAWVGVGDIGHAWSFIERHAIEVVNPAR